MGLRRRQRPSESGEGAAQTLRRILQINRKLNSNLPTAALLEHALDAAIDQKAASRRTVAVLDAEKKVMTSKGKKRKVKDAGNGQPAVFKWKKQRLK